MLLRLQRSIPTTHIVYQKKTEMSRPIFLIFKNLKKGSWKLPRKQTFLFPYKSSIDNFVLFVNSFFSVGEIEFCSAFAIFLRAFSSKLSRLDSYSLSKRIGNVNFFHLIINITKFIRFETTMFFKKAGILPYARAYYNITLILFLNTLNSPGVENNLYSGES